MTTKLLTNLNEFTEQFATSAVIGSAGQVGVIVTIDNEVMAVIEGLGTRFISVDRGANSTWPTAHTAGATVTVGANSLSGFANPMVSIDSMLVGGAASAPATLAPGTARQFLTLDGSGHLDWENRHAERTFTETVGNGTYTATVVIPAGATVLDVIFRNTALWTASVSAGLVIGDDDDPNGYVETTNVKAAPIADTSGAGAGLSSRLSLGAAIGAYKGGAGKFCIASKTITATITTVDVATGNTGRSRLLVEYVVPAVAAATKA